MPAARLSDKRRLLVFPFFCSERHTSQVKSREPRIQNPTQNKTLLWVANGCERATDNWDQTERHGSLDTSVDSCTTRVTILSCACARFCFSQSCGRTWTCTAVAPKSATTIILRVHIPCDCGYRPVHSSASAVSPYDRPRVATHADTRAISQTAHPMQDASTCGPHSYPRKFPSRPFASHLPTCPAHPLVSARLDPFVTSFRV